MKRILLLILFIVLIAAAYTGYQIAGPVVNSPEKNFFYVPTGTDYNTLKARLLKQEIIPSGFFFDQVSRQGNFTTVRPGRYRITNGSNIINLVKMLKRGNQEPVNLVINKLRTKEDLAGKIGKQFEADSASVIKFLTSHDSLLRYETDTHNVMTLIVPNTYEIYWNGPFSKILDRLKTEHSRFWNGERLQKAAKLNLSPDQVYTMASIVEEETNKLKDKSLIASVYINRIKKGMKLEADPTVKYAMRNFGLKRILYGHLRFPSSYNTYYTSGLPPGPICTPSPETIDAVLNAPDTDYIFFVAKPDFNGYSNFATNYEEHKKFARAYQKALDSLIISKQQKSAVKS